MRKDKRGQTGGLVTGLVFGIASLIIAIIIALVIVTTVGGSSILEKETITTTNESDSSGALVFINSTTYTLAEAASAYSGADGYTITAMWAEYYSSNGTGEDTGEWAGYNVSLEATNYTIDSATGILEDAGTYDFDKDLKYF